MLRFMYKIFVPLDGYTRECRQHASAIMSKETVISQGEVDAITPLYNH